MAVIMTALPTWISTQNNITNYAAVNYAAAAGVAIGALKRGDQAHLLVTKNATMTVKVHGYANSIGNWALLQSVAFSDADSESYLLRGISAFDRLQTSCNALGSSGAANVWIGFTGRE